LRVFYIGEGLLVCHVFRVSENEDLISIALGHGQCRYRIGGPPSINSQSFTGKTEFPYDVPFAQNNLQARFCVLKVGRLNPLEK
jgi:hypothetical protein